VAAALTDEALDVLMRKRAVVPDSSEWVFPRRVGNRHLVEPMMAWRAILKAAKITERTRIHDLRHTLSTYMAEGGAPESTIADAMGHILQSSPCRDLTPGLRCRAVADVPGSDGECR
jgi:integrase